MKRILCLLMVVVTMMSTAITAEASEQTKYYDRRFKAWYSKLELEVLDNYEELDDEEKKIITSVDIDYIKMGQGIYEILIYAELYDDDIITIDLIYDIVEDDGYAYMLLNNERIAEDELEELYPEVINSSYEISLP